MKPPAPVTSTRGLLSVLTLFPSGAAIVDPPFSPTGPLQGRPDRSPISASIRVREDHYHCCGQYTRNGRSYRVWLDVRLAGAGPPESDPSGALTPPKLGNSS